MNIFVASFKDSSELGLAAKIEKYLQSERVGKVISLTPYAFVHSSGKPSHFAIIVHEEKSTEDKAPGHSDKKNEWNWSESLKDVLRVETVTEETGKLEDSEDDNFIKELESALDSGAKDPDKLVKSKQLEVESGNHILSMTTIKGLTIWERVNDDGITSAMFFGEFLKYNPTLIDQIYYKESIETFQKIINSFKNPLTEMYFDIQKIEIGDNDGSRFLDIHFKNMAPFSASLTPF